MASLRSLNRDIAQRTRVTHSDVHPNGRVDDENAREYNFTEKISPPHCGEEDHSQMAELYLFAFFAQCIM